VACGMECGRRFNDIVGGAGAGPGYRLVRGRSSKGTTAGSVDTMRVSETMPDFEPRLRSKVPDSSTSWG
jgi:hypothetical protein